MLKISLQNFSVTISIVNRHTQHVKYFLSVDINFLHILLVRELMAVYVIKINSSLFSLRFLASQLIRSLTSDREEK